MARELKRAGGGEIAEEVRGCHLLGQAGLEELEEQVVVGACHIQEGYNHIRGELMTIFGDKGKKREKKSWWERGEGMKETKARTMNEGFVCGEEEQWARDCKKKEEQQNYRRYTCGTSGVRINF